MEIMNLLVKIEGVKVCSEKLKTDAPKLIDNTTSLLSIGSLLWSKDNEKTP